MTISGRGSRRALKLLLSICPIVLLGVVAAASVTITNSTYSDKSGVFLEPYYDNINPPLSGCTTPCLSADTQNTIPNPTSGSLALDGSATGTWSSGSSFTITATTTKTNDVIVLWIVTYLSSSSVTISSISDSLGQVSWQGSARTSNIECSGTQETTQTEWYGIATGTITSDVITINLSGTPTAASGEEFAITGANTGSPFDPNSNVPKTASSSCTSTSAAPSVSGISTNSPNDFVVAFFGGYTSVTQTVGAIAGTTATKIKSVAGTGDSIEAEYRIVSATQSGVSCAFGSSTTYWGIECDAIVQGAGSFTLPASSTMYLWSPQFGSSTSIPAGSLSFQLFADPPAPTQDGSASGTWSSGTSFTIPSVSTTNANDVIVLSIVANDGSTTVTVSSISDSLNSITWQSTARASTTFCTSTEKSSLVEWYGIASSVLTNDVITVRLSTTPLSASGIAFGVAGVDTTTPFDPNSVLPKGGSTCSASASAPSVGGVSTDADTDLVFALFGGYASVTETAGTIGSGTSSLVTTVSGTGNSNAAEFLAESTSQSSISCKYGTSTTYYRILCDALMPARQSITVSYETTNSAGTVQSTMISSASATITDLYQPVSLSSSAGIVPSSGYVLVLITGPSGVALTVFWGSGNPTNYQVGFTYQS